MENQPGKDVFCLRLWSTRSHFVPIFSYKHTKGVFLAESLPEIVRFLSPSIVSERFVFPHVIAPCRFALGVAFFCGFITALSLYSHIIERLGERMKQDSQYYIRYLLVYLIPLTPVLVILVLHHKMIFMLQIIILHAR